MKIFHFTIESLGLKYTKRKRKRKIKMENHWQIGVECPYSTLAPYFVFHFWCLSSFLINYTPSYSFLFTNNIIYSFSMCLVLCIFVIMFKFCYHFLLEIIFRIYYMRSARNIIYYFL